MKYQNIRNADALCQNLGITKEFLTQVLQSPILHYRVVSIPKRGRKGRRELYIANDILKAVQKIIRDDLTGRMLQVPEYVQGFVRERSIATNASHHLAKQKVLNLDIENYFESISERSVEDVFISYDANTDIAPMLSGLCTCNGHLVTGTVCSPVISNLVFSDCDKALHELALETQSIYSRYVDDITFSGDTVPALHRIDEILEARGFARNKKKTYYQTRGKRQYVTGLTVFDHVSPRIPRWKKKKLRSDIYYIGRFGLASYMDRLCIDMPSWYFIETMEGKLSFYRSIEPWFVDKYLEEWERIKEENL